MKKAIKIGTSDFKKIIEENTYYVDKTPMIKEVINDPSEVILLPRPRRFGKTLNMSMLYYFFDQKNAQENRKLFEGLKISKEPEYETEQGKYPVILISFKDIKDLTFEDALSNIRNIISSTYKQFENQINFKKIQKDERNIFKSILERKSEKIDTINSLKLLTEILYTSTGTKPILLIDEYDTPIHASYTNQYYDSMVNFMSMFLGAALKDNIHLHKGILTGTLRISRESIFTGLNNISVYSLLNSEYSSWFGFTNDELSQLLKDYDLEPLESSIKAWYNGYIFGNKEIYNPWSILNFVKSEDKRFIAHWVNTANNDLIKELIVDSSSAVRLELQELLKGKSIIKVLDENIVFKDLKKSENVVFSFLVFSGYLKAKLAKFEDTDYWYELSTPNEEVRKLFSTIILQWMEDSLVRPQLQNLLQALVEGNIPVFERLLSQFVLTSLSYHTLSTDHIEKVYQSFMLGLLVSLADQYELTSEKESGFGRYDLALVPHNKNKKAIIMEFKTIDDFYDETKDQALESALKQIEDRQYETAIKQRGYSDILKMAVVFDGKRVWVKV